jgi:hypothetical protein
MANVHQFVGNKESKCALKPTRFDCLLLIMSPGARRRADAYTQSSECR